MDYKTVLQDKVSLLGMGCMRLPVLDGNPAKIDEAAALAVIDDAIRGGVNYFDTAYTYHHSRSEPFVGRALARYPRSSYYLATKMPTWMLHKKEDMQRIFEDQLQRLGVDYFDYYLAHSLDAESFENAELLGLYDFLAAQKQAGRIRHIGFSFHDKPPVLKKICAAHPWEFVQLMINYLDWEAYQSAQQYQIARQHKLPIIIMEPVRGGQLADLGPAANQILHKAAPQRTVASWGFRYAAGLPGVFTILSGMTTPAQLADNLHTLSKTAPFTPAEKQALEQATALYRESRLIPCTNCKYCMPCPTGVDIPGIFGLFNKNAFEVGMDPMWAFKEEYAAMAPAHKADKCIRCGACTKVCPQGIPIPDVLAQLHAGKRPKEY